MDSLEESVMWPRHICFIIVLWSCSLPLEDTKPMGASDYSLWDMYPSYWYNSYFPLTFVYSEDFNDDFTSDHDDADGNNPLEQALLQWDNAVALQSLFSLPLQAVPNKEYPFLRDYRDGEMGIYKHYTWFDHIERLDDPREAMAVAQIYSEPRDILLPTMHYQILHIDILFNYRDFEFSTDFSRNTHDIQTIFVHEIGHSLGLRHQNTAPSVMREELATTQVRRQLRDHDLSTVRRFYSPSSTMRTATGLQDSEIDRDDVKDVLSYDEDELVRIIIALRSNGECVHYKDQKVILKHSLFDKNMNF